MFVGSAHSDVKTFLCYFENVVMCNKIDEEKALQLPCYLDSRAFHLFCHPFAEDEGISGDASSYRNIRKHS